MRILIVVLNAGHGGHTRTAASVSDALRARGHHIEWVIGSEADDTIPKKHGFLIHTIETNRPMQLLNWNNVLGHNNLSFDIVHTFSIGSLSSLVYACKRRKIPVVWSICGGRAPASWDYPVLRSIISLSQEVKDCLIRESNITSEDVHVIPARVETNRLFSVINNIDAKDINVLKRKLGIRPSDYVILRVARIAPAYEASIRLGVLATRKLFDEGYNVKFVHVGYVQCQKSHNAILDAITKAHAGLDTNFIVSITDEKENALIYNNIASIILGSGRGAFEGMLSGNPVIVVGSNGCGGLVTDKTIEEISYYNFSGRNQQVAMSFDQMVSSLANTIKTVIDCPDISETSSAYGQQYVFNTLDIERATVKYEEVYRKALRAPFPSYANLIVIYIVQCIKLLSSRSRTAVKLKGHLRKYMLRRKRTDLRWLDSV